MSNIAVYNLNGEKVKEIELVDTVFATAVKASVIHQVAVAQLSNRRWPFAHTKDRSEVRGGGKKPWKQKHTGRARHGSIRSPLWRGGGVTFGPQSERNFEKKVNKKMKQKALFMCVSERIRENHVFLLETLTLPSGKTKDILRSFQRLPSQTKKTLVACVGKNPVFLRSVKNIQHIKAVGVNSLNVVDLLNYDYFVTTEEGLSRLREIYKKI